MTDAALDESNFVIAFGTTAVEPFSAKHASVRELVQSVRQRLAAGCVASGFPKARLPHFQAKHTVTLGASPFSWTRETLGLFGSAERI